MQYAIGLDIGTSAVKGVLVDEKINIVKDAECKFTYFYPNDNEVVIGAKEYLDSCYAVLRELASALPEDGEIVGICEASASGNLLVLDKDCNPLTPIYNWQDKRVDYETEQVLGKELVEKIYNVVGWPCVTEFPLALLCWLKVHHPEIIENSAYITMSTEYLNYMLCGEWGISPSAGTPFHLIEQETGKYYKPFLDKIGIPESKLPPILPIGTTIGTLTKEASLMTKIPEGTPVKLGTFDHICGAIGAEVTNVGQMMLSCGTSWVAFNPVKNRDVGIKTNMLVDPFLSGFGGNWCTMNSLPSIAHNINEYIKRYISDGNDRFDLLDKYSLEGKNMESELEIDPTVSPDDSPALYEYDKRIVARALMVGVAKKVAENIDSLAENGITADTIIMVGGPSKSKVWQMVIEEITAKSVKGANGAHTGAVGAAKIAFGLIK